jgi:hypothetical protein
MLEYHAAFYKFPEDDGWYVVTCSTFRASTPRGGPCVKRVSW